MKKRTKAFITFIECSIAYLIICGLGYGTIKIFNNSELTTLVIGLIGSIISLIINIVSEKINAKR